MSQAVVNIMTAGHVDSGKTTLVQAITGKWADTHSEEVKRGITIKLGYADVTFYKYADGSFGLNEKSEKGDKGTATRKVSFVDAPGHETLMATVIAASSIVDGAILVIAANEQCPQAQTREHVMVLEAIGIKHLVVAQTKIDLVPKERALASYKEITDFLAQTKFKGAPVVPVASNARVNMGKLVEAIEETIPTPTHAASEKPLMYIVRSFDVNKPGTALAKLQGGVIGGAVISGAFKKGEEIEIVPGVQREKKGKISYQRISTKIESLYAGSSSLESAAPGGLIAIGTLLDPALSHQDALVGSMAAPKGVLGEPLHELQLDVTPIARTENPFADTFVENEPLIIGAGTATTVGFVNSFKKRRLHLTLKKPILAFPSQTMAVMRRAGTRWLLFGTAKMI